MPEAAVSLEAEAPRFMQLLRLFVFKLCAGWATAPELLNQSQRHDETTIRPVTAQWEGGESGDSGCRGRAYRFCAQNLGRGRGKRSDAHEFSCSRRSINVRGESMSA